MTFPTFAEFFEAANDYQPYEWQTRLAQQLADDGQWPWHVAVPTGLGKTSCIDIALYDLARQLNTNEGSGSRVVRTAPQRIYHVVDRRTIIDSAVNHAKKLAGRIESAMSGPLLMVKEALSRLCAAGVEEVIHVTGIHGEDPDDFQWMRRVTGCTIVSLTSHQFVSRLLLRGYGVSPGAWPVAAALTALDRLVLFDEPHLSTQAVNTILAVERLQMKAETDLGLPRSTTVLLGATVPKHLSDLGTGSIKVCAEREHREARRRLQAYRPTTVNWLDGCKDAPVLKELSAAVLDVVEKGANRVVVFVNTVGLAQDLYRKLLEKGKLKRPIRLATSRFRPYDKFQLQDLQEPVILVATQTLEVGVDLSFDALVTELCPWSSLMQRFGRFNRYGEYSNDKHFQQRSAVIVAGWAEGKPQLREASKSVYGEDALAGCARLLQALTDNGTEPKIDFVPDICETVKDLALVNTVTDPKPPRVGTLTAAMLPLMAQTQPPPAADFQIGALVAGPDVRSSDEVELVWREFLDIFDEEVATLRISPAEVVSIPRRAWAVFLSKKPDSTKTLSDIVFSSDESTVPSSDIELSLYRVWDSAGGKWSVPVDVHQLVRASRVVMSEHLGGYTPELGWTGVCGEKLKLDISLETASAELAQLGPGRFVDLVLSRGRIGNDAQCGEAEKLYKAFDDISNSIALGVLANEVNMDTVENAAIDYVHQLLADKKQSLNRPKPIVLISRPNVVVVRIRSLITNAAGRLRLDEHQAHVGDWAERDAATLGLRDELVAEIGYAAAHHDDGKASPEFQRYLHGNDSPASEFLAKSGRIAESRWVDRQLRQAAGLPDGWRHEGHSLRSIPVDKLLIRHLIGSHHGWYRPVLPPLPDRQTIDGYPGPVEHATEFEELNARYGVWGLAFLESIVRMADWRASAAPIPKTRPVTRLVTVSESQPLSSKSQTSIETRKEFVFKGLQSHPMTGWFAAVGLLAAASSIDTSATLRWQPLDNDQSGIPLIPVLVTSKDLSWLIDLIYCKKMPKSVLAETEGLSKPGLRSKNQKVSPAGAVRRILECAEDPAYLLLTGIVNDLLPVDVNGKLPLAIAACANNASFVQIAYQVLQQKDALSVSEKALTDLSVGYTEAKCDGGMDRSMSQIPAENGLGNPNGRFIRSALAPLALYGMASFGGGLPHGIGVVEKGKLVLPLPRTEQTFAQLRALTYLGRGRPNWDWTSDGLEWIYAAGTEKPTQYEVLWIGRVVPR